MRASRLVSILLLLQRRQPLTAQQLADEVEVNVRTIYRDIDALQLAGVPIYGHAGHGGGYRLIDGFRTRLDGLTVREAESLVMAGLPGAATELGLGPEIASLTLKLQSALSPELRDRSDAMAQRFLFDPSGWFHDGDPSPFLITVTQAVWELRPLRVTYQGWQATAARCIEPHGMVLKGGKWYLVARSIDRPSSDHTDIRTYRVNQFQAVDVLAGTFEPEPDFDLARHWGMQVLAFRTRLQQDEATIRISTRGRERLGELDMPQTVAAVDATSSPPDSQGWVTATVPIESVTHTVSEFLRLGPEIEVIAPREIRETIVAAVDELIEVYRPTNRQN